MSSNRGYLLCQDARMGVGGLSSGYRAYTASTTPQVHFYLCISLSRLLHFPSTISSQGHSFFFLYCLGTFQNQTNLNFRVSFQILYLALLPHSYAILVSVLSLLTLFFFLTACQCSFFNVYSIVMFFILRQCIVTESWLALNFCQVPEMQHHASFSLC